MGLHQRYEEILAAVHHPLTLDKAVEDGIRKKITEAFDGMMSALFEEKGAALDINILATDKVQHFIETHSSALDSSFAKVEMSDGMRKRLQRSNYIFSGIKTFHELNEAFPSLLDENGNRKTFEQFLNDVQKIDSTYNRNYLRAEYNFVQQSAEMASKWEDFAEDGDRYNLQYRTAGDDKVRPEHAALNGVTLPFSDPFWEEYYPPNGWNCRCTVVQVRKSKYPETPRDEAMARGEEALQKDSKGIFHFNAGKEKKSVPDYNPYTIKRCRDCDVAKGKTTLAFVSDNELCDACRLLREQQAQRSNPRPTSTEISELSRQICGWADGHLDQVQVADSAQNGNTQRRTYVEAGNDTIGVGKKFFTETLSKNKRNPEVTEVLEAATKFKEWMPTAQFVGMEEGRHHNFNFAVYRAEYEGRTIEFKCKETDGKLAYTMRFI